MCNFESTFCSKGNNAKSFIDHFCLTVNLLDALQIYDVVNNRSDHVAVKCTLHIKVTKFEELTTDYVQSCKVNWKFASSNDIDRYRHQVDEYGTGIIDKSWNFLQCEDFLCQDDLHREEIVQLHDEIVMIMLRASDE